MDFFEHQEVARKKTGRLVALFGLCVAGIVAAIYGVMVLFLVHYPATTAAAHAGRSAPAGWWYPQLLLGVIVGVGGLILLGSLLKLAQLRGGGAAVAESLGGKLLTHAAADPLTRRVLNVVEEMAIASGTPVPPVYLLEHEQGLNAFAAGYSLDDAVIGITRGAAERLTRPQLQGVIAHEFSHILNGDMRLNIRLISLLAGIVVIAMTGRVVLRSAIYAPRVRSRSSRDSNPLPLLALGAGLLVIGSIGALFASIIRAAVSRQREYLADAAAVQFTRDPDTIAGALKAIGATSSRSRLDHPNAPEASHMFFASGVAVSLNSLFATHPPLRQRIARVDPTWDGKFPSPPPLAAAAPVAGIAAVSAAARLAAAARAPKSTPGAASRAVADVGQPKAGHVALAEQLLARMPEALRDAAHDPFGARAVIYAMLLDRDPASESRARQWTHLEAHADKAVLEMTRKIEPLISNLDTALRLPLIDIALPTLRHMTISQFEPFEKSIDALIRADRRMDTFEWVLAGLLRRHLTPHYRNVRKPRVDYYSLRTLGRECGVLLSALARAGGEKTAAREAFTRAARHLEPVRVPWLDADQSDLAQLDAALEKLNTAAPALKKSLLEATAACVLADQQVTWREVELLRAVADRLDCPMPPVLIGRAAV